MRHEARKSSKVECSDKSHAQSGASLSGVLTQLYPHAVAMAPDPTARFLLKLVKHSSTHAVVVDHQRAASSPMMGSTRCFGSPL
jgi:hypothetical protein